MFHICTCLSDCALFGFELGFDMFFLFVSLFFSLSFFCYSPSRRNAGWRSQHIIATVTLKMGGRSAITDKSVAM